jgi:glycine betaine/proline transport system substrate-binding protein
MKMNMEVILLNILCMKQFKWLIMNFMIIMLLIALTACGAANNQEQGQQDEGKPKKNDPITFADAGWDSLRFHNAVAQFIAEKGYGYETEVTVGSTPATLQGIQTGSIDAYMEIWTTNILDKYNEMLDNGVVELSVNFDDNAQGLYVPTYMIKGDPNRGIEPMTPNLKSVKDLPEYWEIFKDPENPSKGRIYGSPPGWEVDQSLGVKMKTYNLEETYTYFRPGSGAALAASIESAFEKGEPWVGYYWDPTWITGKFDLTLLEEPEYTEECWGKDLGCEFPPNRVTIAVHEDMVIDAPDFVEFLKNYKTSSDLTAEALAYMQDNDATVEQAAEWFLKEKQDLWTQWVPEEIADKVKNAI